MTEKIKTLQIIHLALCAGLIVAYFMIGEISVEKLKTIPTVDSSSIVFAVIPFLAIILTHFLFRSQLKQVDPKLKLEDKLPFYQTACIIRWAILEGAAFIILILKPDFFNIWNTFNNIPHLFKTNGRKDYQRFFRIALFTARHKDLRKVYKTISFFHLVAAKKVNTVI